MSRWRDSRSNNDFMTLVVWLVDFGELRRRRWRNDPRSLWTGPSRDDRKPIRENGRSYQCNGVPYLSKAFAASCKPRARPSWTKAVFKTSCSAVLTSMAEASGAVVGTSSLQITDKDKYGGTQICSNAQTKFAILPFRLRHDNSRADVLAVGKFYTISNKHVIITQKNSKSFIYNAGCQWLKTIRRLTWWFTVDFVLVEQRRGWIQSVTCFCRPQTPERVKVPNRSEKCGELCNKSWKSWTVNGELFTFFHPNQK